MPLFAAAAHPGCIKVRGGIIFFVVFIVIGKMGDIIYYYQSVDGRYQWNGLRDNAKKFQSLHDAQKKAEELKHTTHLMVQAIKA